MDRTLRALVLAAVLAAALVSLPPISTTAAAAELDKKGKSDAKEAMRFYKEGNYEDAARLFLRLSINYPDMLVFVRNLGACYYYMRRYEPALSNLRDYVHRKTDIADDDRAEVSGWIGEMERLRDQATAPAAAPAPVVPPAVVPPASVPAPVPAPSLPVPSAGDDAAASGASAPTPSSPVPAVPAAPATPPAAAAAPVPPAAPPTAPEAVVAQPAGPAAQGVPEFPSQPSSPSAPVPTAQYAPPAAEPYGMQPQYGGQPAYGPQSQYQAAPGPYGVAPYPPHAQTYPAAPGYAPYPPGGVATQAKPAPRSSTGRKVGAWMLGIVGVGALGGGGYLSYLALDRFHQIEKKYDPDKEKQAKKYVIASGVCYGVGGVALLSAIILGATGGSSGQVALAPAVGPDMAGATVAGSF